MTRSRANVYKASSRMHATRTLCIALAVALCSCTLDFPQPSSWAANDVEDRASPAPGGRATAESNIGAPTALPARSSAGGEQAAMGAGPDVNPSDQVQPEAPAPPEAPAGGMSLPDVPEAPAANVQTGTVPGDPSMSESSEGGEEQTQEPFVLTPVGFPSSGQGLRFPNTALSPYDRSPAFTWSGVPEGTKSLALVFRDRDLDLVRWLIWDIPPTVAELPEGITPFPNPDEVPGSSQTGSLGTGYSPPRIPNGEYEFVLWALDVETLPNTLGLSADQILSRRLPMHVIETTEPVIVVNAR
jgi:Raf kinase inhibitor-like YbhB/YbcL family protein